MKKVIINITVVITAFAFYFLNEARALEYKIDHFKLENGMEVYLIENHKVPVIFQMVWYKVGGIDEPAGRSGVAHLLEHMMFKGTEKFPDGEFSRLIAKNGGNDNAFTAADFTAYFQTIAKDKIELAMEMEADRMQNLILKETDLLKERDVVLEERRSRVDNKPSSILYEQMKASLFQNHQYQKPLIGWYHEIAELGLSDLKQIYQKYYTPKNAILIITGDITKAELEPLAKKYYGVLRSKEKPVKRSFLKEPETYHEKRVIVKDQKVRKPEFNRMYIAPSENYGQKELAFPLILLSKMLGGGSTSKLYEELVIKEKIASSVDSDYENLKIGPSFFAISALPNNGKTIEELEQKIDEKIEEIKLSGFSEKELEHAKKALTADMIYSQEDLKTFGFIYGQAILVGVGSDYIRNWEDRINAVTQEDIAKALGVLNKDKSVTGILKREYGKEVANKNGGER